MIAMSGGVDSSAAAALLKQQSYACFAVLFIMHGNEDQQAARAACQLLEIPLEIIDVKERFNACIVKDFIDVYQQGKTPNPCVRCNHEIKFSLMSELAEEKGIRYLASGHYARINYAGQDPPLSQVDETKSDEIKSKYLAAGRNLLLKALDENKDQSYMLYRLTQEQLARLLLPLGELSKDQARKIAAKYLPDAAGKPESQDLCFVPDGDYGAFIEREIGLAKPGSIVNKAGEYLGQHRGLIHYTVGQRKGLGVALGEPHFVIAKDALRNEIILGSKEDLFGSEVLLEGINLIAVSAIKEPLAVDVKTRYRAKAASALIQQISPESIELKFLQKEKLPAPGQSVVFYQDDLVIGGGIAR